MIKLLPNMTIYGRVNPSILQVSLSLFSPSLVLHAVLQNFQAPPPQNKV